MIVERQSQLDELCHHARREGRLAFDTEFVMEDRYQSELCLVQVATNQTVALLDPFLELDLAPLWDAICDETVETIVHAGQEDLALCVQHTGRVPRAVFDAQIAAGLVGHDYPLSLQRLVQATLHIRLHKAKTLTNWRKRPLTAAQIGYAAEDVCFLLEVHQKLSARLAQLDRTEWAREEFSRFEDMTLYRRADAERVLRIKGAGALRGRQLAVLHALCAWREEIAKRINRPPRVALKDHLMVEIARQEITQFAEVRDLRGVNLSDRDVHALVRVVQKALTIPEVEWPQGKPHEPEPPRESALLALATAVIKSYCLENDLAYSLVATQRSIRELVRHRTTGQPQDDASVELLRGWRGRSVGARLDEVLAGRRSVRVEPVDGELSVHVTGPVADDVGAGAPA